MLAFRKKYTMEEWFQLVKCRQQEIGESAAKYALEKIKLLRLCPEPFAERKFVTYLMMRGYVTDSLPEFTRINSGIHHGLWVIREGSIIRSTLSASSRGDDPLQTERFT